MCTIILLYKMVPSYPIILAGNRDEFLARSSLPPGLWSFSHQGQSIKIFSGKDQKAGGTWLGINRYGVVAGVTNYFTGSRDPTKNSRGNLVLDCLAGRDPDRILTQLRAEKTFKYNPFNLFCLSQERGFLFSNHPQPRALAMKKGIYILTNGDIDDPRDPKKKWLFHRLGSPLFTQDHNALESLLSQLLASHGNSDNAEDICIHLPGYGTVSSCLLFMNSRQKQSRFLYCHGAPCRNQYQDLSDQFLQLFQISPFSSRK